MVISAKKTGVINKGASKDGDKIAMELDEIGFVLFLKNSS